MRTYYVDNGKGYKMAFYNIVDARKYAAMLLDEVVKHEPNSVKDIIYTKSHGVPIYTSKRQFIGTVIRFVNYYDWQKKGYGFEYIEYDPKYGTKHVPMLRNGKLER